ncbi:pogo transposable element derived with ZNF domain a isoform X2 [Clupea harengus]|uniref:Pogo transposable element derived with ZNF domain a isoform X2 n=1 Tax=Clupea harengus TaxID=7950 RepID=A0A6P8H3F7_CLUHA|nr:pogo transposable element derived with ZNF domain a isoform X2 [Clupea harengus]
MYQRSIEGGAGPENASLGDKLATELVSIGTGLPETMSESSELLMQCDEEDLDPWQQVDDDARSERNKLNASKTTKSPSIVSPAASSAAQVPTEGKNAALPIVSATAVPIGQTLVPQILQPLQVASNITSGVGTPGQPIYITSSTLPVSNSIGTTMGQTIGFILNGQTYLTAGTSHQLIAPKPPAQTPMQVPVTLTITGPSGIQTVSALATAGVHQLNLTDSDVTPTSSAVMPTSMATVSAPLGVSSQQYTAPAPVLSPSLHTFPVALANGSTTVSARSTAPPGPLAPPSPAAPSTSTFQLRVPSSHSKAAQSCARCRSPYKMVASLRGYMCMCNKVLMKAIQDLEPTKKKDKRYTNPSHQRFVGSSSKSSKRPPAQSLSSRISQSSSDEEEEEEEEEEDDYEEEEEKGRSMPQEEKTGGKLIMLVEDFYYGLDRGTDLEKKQPEDAVMFKCHLCEKKLKNNLKMMVHTKHHVESDQKYEAESQTTCQHCFRNFPSPLSLQSHVERVHSQAESSTKCRICELAYENEPIFLQHMKNSHKPGEMPYVCQVCGFRSSFYLDVIFHFRDTHSNTTHLLCPYCLKVFRSSSNYQLHYSRHQKKSVLHCDKCRLQFLFVKDKAEHKHMYHNTHRKPLQLEGLKPGTRVTIRTYAALSPASISGGGVSRVIEVPSMPPLIEPWPARQPTPTRSNTPTSHIPEPRTPTRANAANSKFGHMSPPSNISPAPLLTPLPSPVPILPRKVPSVSLQDVMTKFEQQKPTLEKGSCVECTFEIPNYSQHYPTYVHCSICRYSTCCSRSYANHMINNHVSRKTGKLSKYLSMFRPCPRDLSLNCLSCHFTTKVGDMMANHLVEYPEHCGGTYKARDGFSTGYKRFVIIPNDVLREGETVSLDRQNNPFVQLGADSSESAQPANHSSLAIKKPGKTKKPANEVEVPEKSLSVEQLKIVLFALCCGVPQAAAQFQTQPALIQAWLIARKSQGPSKGRRGLGPRAADRLSEWVLVQREQQLPVNEEKLFQKVKECVGGSDPGLSHDWAVDFLLQHELGVQTVGTAGRVLPQSVEEGVRSFTRFIKKQVGAQGFGLGSVGAVDELAVFIDLEQLDQASSLASVFQLSDPGEPIMEVVLSAMADGTLLPAMVFLTGNPPSCMAAVPASVFLEARPEGFSDEDRLQLWLSKVWRPYINPSAGGKGLLVMDPYRGHLADDFLASLNSANTLPAVVPKACSCCLQPLEACTGPVLREFLQACWSEQVATAPESLIGAQPDELALLVIGWLAQLLQVLGARPELLQRSFKMAAEPLETQAGEGPMGLVQELTRALLQSTPQETEGEGEDDQAATPGSWPSPSSRQKLKQVFEKDSDLESFHGFEEADMGK